MTFDQILILLKKKDEKSIQKAIDFLENSTSYDLREFRDSIQNVIVSKPKFKKGDKVMCKADMIDPSIIYKIGNCSYNHINDMHEYELKCDSKKYNIYVLEDRLKEVIND